MTIDLYCAPSPPSRAVRLVADAVGVELNLKMVNLAEKEQLKPEFLKMNPQHTVPTIDDNGFYLWESRAICTYLIEKYAKNDSLYPKDPKQRAIINQRLYFDMGTLYQAFADYFYPQIFNKASPDPAKLEKCYEAFAFVEKFLEGKKYIAGDHLTVADISLGVTVYNFKIAKFDYSKYKNIVSWLDTVKSEVPKFEEMSDADFKMVKEWMEKMQKK